MRAIPAALAAHLEGDATTLCHAWRVTRRDGVVLGFTEHDRDIRFAGMDFLAATGFQASDTEAGSGLSTDAGDITGGFSSAAISAADVTAGRYDGARVEVFLCNWQAPEQHLLLRVQEIGEVTRAGDAFRAELRRLTHRLDQVQGRIYSRRCDAVLGDARCTIDLEASGLRSEGTVAAIVGATQIRVSGLAGVAAGFYANGTLSVLSGAAAGHVADIDAQGSSLAGVVDLALWLPPPVALSVGDAVRVTAGCDKRFSTCSTRFSNSLNFQGFPHMPGSDFAYGYADGDTVHDGRVLYD